MEPDEREQTKQALFSASIIHWSLVIAVFIYALVGWLVSRQSEPAVEWNLVRLVLIAMVAVSVLNIVLAFVFRRLKLHPSSLLNEEDDLESALQNYQTGYIIQGALFEAVAIYGLVLTLLTSSLTYFLGFGAVALGFLLIFHPSRNDFESRLQEARRERNMP